MSTLHFHGHATFEIHTGETKLLVDPFLDDNPQATVKAADVDPSVILLTHGHQDHVADAVAIAKRTGALVICNFEIANWLKGQGVEHTHPMHLGGGCDFPFGRVKLTPALHGSMLPDGSYGGMPGGFLLHLDDAVIYIAGDTALFSDMSLIGEANIDCAVLPIGDNFTMGPDDAARAVEFLKPKTVVPCHYGTWPVIDQDPDAFAELVRTKTSASVSVLGPGESIEVRT